MIPFYVIKKKKLNENNFEKFIGPFIQVQKHSCWIENKIMKHTIKVLEMWRQIFNDDYFYSDVLKSHFEILFMNALIVFDGGTVVP